MNCSKELKLEQLASQNRYEFSADARSQTLDNTLDDFQGMQTESMSRNDENESAQSKCKVNRPRPTLLEYALQEFKKAYPVRMVVFSPKQMDLYFWNGTVYQRDTQEAYTKSRCIEVLDLLIPRELREEETKETVIPEIENLIPEKVRKDYYCKPGYREKLSKLLLEKIKCDTELLVSFFRFDEDVCMVNTPDGIVNLADLTIRKQTPEDYMMKCTRGRFIPEQRVGLESLLFYDTMLQPFTNGIRPCDNEASILRDYFTNISAAALLGGAKFKAVFIEKGPPDCGKTLRINTISHVINSYAGIVTPASLIRATENDTQRRPDLIALIGCRLLIVQEPDPHRPLNVAQLKAISGGDKISLRQPRDPNPIDVNIVGAVYIVCNLMVDFKTKENVEEAALNRMRIMEWKYSVCTKDESLPERLRDSDEVDRLFTEMCFHAHEVLVNRHLPQNQYMNMSVRKVALLQSDYVSEFFRDVLILQCPYTMSPDDYIHELTIPYSSAILLCLLKRWLWEKLGNYDPIPSKTVFQRIEEVLRYEYGIEKTRLSGNNAYIGICILRLRMPVFSQ